MHDIDHRFERVGLLGYGTMGAAIARVLAASGRTVTVVDIVEARLEEASDHVTSTRAVSDLHGVDLVIESVIENLDVKRALLAEVASVVGEGVPIVTTTSGFSVTEVSTAVLNPERVAGLHFSIRAPGANVVEVVRGVRTEDTVVQRLVSFVEALDKAAVVVDDKPGFLIDSLLLPYFNDVVQALDDGLATAADIDLALELGLGYKRGPLAMLDGTGLDVHLDETSALHARTGDPRYSPPPLLQLMVAAGHHGAKNGNGFRTSERD